MKVECISFAVGSKKIDQKLRFGEKFINKTGIPFTYSNEKKPLEFIKELFENLTGYEDADALLHITQSQENALPNDASLLQDLCGFNKNILSLTINQGCSGFVQALILANSLIDSYNYKKIIIITNDWYTNFINYKDRATSALFSDGAAVTIVTNEKGYKLKKHENYTDGKGWKFLYKKNNQVDSNIFMDGLAIYEFTKKIVINEIIKKNININDINNNVSFYIHQASDFVLNEIYKVIPKEFCFSNLNKYGNTVSSTIPILINEHPFNAKKIFLIGFGVGLSASIIELEKEE